LLPNSLPTFTEITRLEIQRASPSIAGIPLPIILLPLSITLCLLPALDALLRPGPTYRPTGEAARRRAQPWLIASTLILVVISLLVAWVMWRVITFSAALAGYEPSIFWFASHLTLYDILIAGLIALTVLALGQALVSYEIFTGRTLPRQGLKRSYRNTVLLSAGLSAVVAGAHALNASAIYGLLLALLLSAGFFAVLTWRTFVERDWTIRRLRPFVSSQRLYTRVVGEPGSPADAPDLDQPFRALCHDVLDTSRAALVALGTLAPLVSRPLLYPAGESAEFPWLEELRRRFDSPLTAAIELDPTGHAGFTLAVPLWSERGLIGVLLLVEKNGRGYYTQEEIEIARASGERLIDTEASAEIVRRLTALQRQRMVAGQVVDRRMRRELHDEVLPVLHTSLLKLSAAQSQDPEVQAAAAQLAGLHRQISALLRDLPSPGSPDLPRLGLVAALRRMVEQDLAGPFDQARFSAGAEADSAARRLTPIAAEVLYYAAREAVRNAARHARTERPLHLNVTIAAVNGLTVVVEDNGAGLPNTLTATQPDSTDGAGQGLALHTTLMAVIGGSLELESQPGRFTRVILKI
jgi:signal transduction histidine kinase